MVGQHETGNRFLKVLVVIVLNLYHVQCPPLVTVWIYTILQLDLGPAVLSLCTVASFVWWKGLEIK
jgi:hypothetical protein